MAKRKLTKGVLARDPVGFLFFLYRLRGKAKSRGWWPGAFRKCYDYNFWLPRPGRIIADVWIEL